MDQNDFERFLADKIHQFIFTLIKENEEFGHYVDIVRFYPHTHIIEILADDGLEDVIISIKGANDETN